MKLLIISHTPHYDSGRELRGWAATVREIDRLAGIFSSVVHVAPLHSGQAPASFAAYEARNIEFVPVPPAGGKCFFKKMGILMKIPFYMKAILGELKKAEAVHVRCPSNIGLLAAIALCFVSRPQKRWIKYAGNWKPEGAEPWSYTLQRALLQRNCPKAEITVNGEWPDQPPYIHSFLNPCVSLQELERASVTAVRKQLEGRCLLLYAGRVESEKGAGRAIEILKGLRGLGHDAFLDIAGDGEERYLFERQTRESGLESFVRFHGWLSRGDMDRLYAQAHFLVLPAESSEGWPKVLGEAMAFGAVPIAGAVSSIPGYLGRFQTGKTFSPGDTQAFCDAIGHYCRNEGIWKKESLRAVQAAASFTYERYLQAVKDMLKL